MKKIINAPENYVDEMLQGIYASFPDQVKCAADDPRCYCIALDLARCGDRILSDPKFLRTICRYLGRKVNGNALTGYEGPSLVKFNGQYWLYTDKLDSYPAGSADGKNGIFVQRSNSLATGWWGNDRITTKNLDGRDIPNRHGTVMVVSDPAAKKVVWEARARAGVMLGSMKFTAEEMRHPCAGLSGGQKAKLMFLLMALSGANVLLLDEPTRNLSPLSGPVVRDLFAQYEGCIIAVSHDRLFMREACTRVETLTPQGLVKVDSI